MRPLDEIYDEILNKPVTPRASLLLIKGLKEEGKRQMVIKACQKALEFFPDDISIRRVLAETYVEEGSIDLAQKELTRLCEQIDELSSVLKLQAEVFIEEGKTKKARECLELYLAHHRSDKEAAQVLSKLSSPLKKEPSILPTSTLAEIYYKQGELEAAIRIYEQTVKAFPDDEKAKRRLDELRKIREAEEHGKAKDERLRERKLQLIKVLERWLVNIAQRTAMNLSHQP
jgi:tetratricopeptide (TPR) repeat protein